MNILAIIPARSGSKRVPGKNVRPLGGKPLLLWTVDAAIEAKGRLAPEHQLDVCLSTDSQDYVDIVLNHLMTRQEAGTLKDYSILVVRRSGALAEDCDTAEVILDAMRKMEERPWPPDESRGIFIDGSGPPPSFLSRKGGYDVCVTLQPTSPFRSWKDITDCINLYESSRMCSIHTPPDVKVGHDCVFTARPVTEFPQWMFVEGGHSYLGIPTRYLSGIIAQDLPKLYFPNGAVYLSSRELITAEHPRIYGDRCGIVVMDKLRSLDIEEEGDFAYCEWLLANKKVCLE
jgi:N-acylneuraminate cytidylyltransferase/CMP-N,N'-diacetyllegionaminic acid synthase